MSFRGIGPPNLFFENGSQADGGALNSLPSIPTQNSPRVNQQAFGYGPKSLGECPITPTSSLGGSGSSRPNTPNSANLVATSSSERVTTPHSSSEERKNAESMKTMSLDRSNDKVYAATTNVVKAIMALSQGVEKKHAIDYLELVKSVGFELRTLLGNVDELSPVFPSQGQKYVELFNSIQCNYLINC